TLGGCAGGTASAGTGGAVKAGAGATGTGGAAKAGTGAAGNAGAAGTAGVGGAGRGEFPPCPPPPRCHSLSSCSRCLVGHASCNDAGKLPRTGQAGRRCGRRHWRGGKPGLLDVFSWPPGVN